MCVSVHVRDSSFIAYTLFLDFYKLVCDQRTFATAAAVVGANFASGKFCFVLFSGRN